MGALTSIVAALLLVAATPTDRTEWMRPDAYHLRIGMHRSEAVEALRAWTPKPGPSPDEVIVDFSGEKAATLQFKEDRLVSIRFELFVLLPESRKAFEQVRKALLDTLGAPRKAGKSVLVYDNALPNVMAAVSDDPASEQGKRGLGVLVVRWYDPR